MRKQIVNTILVVSLTANFFLFMFASYQKANAEKAVMEAINLKARADRMASEAREQERHSMEALKACEARIVATSNVK